MWTTVLPDTSLARSGTRIVCKSRVSVRSGVNDLLGRYRCGLSRQDRLSGYSPGRGCSSNVTQVRFTPLAGVYRALAAGYGSPKSV